LKYSNPAIAPMKSSAMIYFFIAMIILEGLREETETGH
jgi:hypothetical protein